jgi:hypothetical protein
MQRCAGERTVWKEREKEKRRKKFVEREDDEDEL